jgi:putative nucleotidyltransferase with HDIG domain
MNRVLVIDDEKSWRVTLCEFLSREGYATDQASEPDQALALIDENEYDVIVTDITMPHESGLELIGRIRERSDASQIVLMTGEPTVDTAVRAVQYGVSDYLTKPISHDTLIKSVRNAAKIKLLNDEKSYLERLNDNYLKILEETVEQRTNELQLAMSGTISLITSIIEIRDPYIAGHQRKVGNLAAAIAEKMNLDPQTANNIRTMGYIHDLGKIGLPAEILTKPGPINYAERELIKMHPRYGYEMLSKVKLPGIFAETIYQHHERCDGSGYPLGLKGDQIRIEAQIIMVADTVEAIMANRSYHPGINLEGALNEIRVNAGILYNAEVVDACAELFFKDNYSLDENEYPVSIPL